ncbi:TonB-dependent receptor plug domain-containing protein [Undibacterium umbellatum]|uniref:TonB-dependent receptor n=1 Tax=Undibacterium umbellatum TaxID=2762300 RepID=A0ABR6ZBH6_9BURK|nr:TonB-dependent receptor [Undibacterium umbellatum]MBC3908686.1 TonB-dependent receptor [Undibacterium umbellatum]
MTSAFKPLALSLALAAAFPTSIVLAQTATVGAAASVMITAGRQTQAAKDVLADNVVISAEDIAKSGAASVVDLLQQQRGIEISRNGGPGTTSSVFMRGGSNAQNVVLIDGVRIGSSTTGGASWSAIPLSQIDHIEVVYGPLSSLYGADAMGGVIQIFTKKGAGSITPTLSAGMGSYGARKLQAGLIGSIAGNLNLSLNAGHEENSGFSATKPAAGPYSYNIDKDGYAMDSFNGRLVWEVSKGFELGASVLHSRNNAQFDSGPTQDDRNITTLENIAVFGRGKFSDYWTASLQFAKAEDKGYTDASYGKSQIDTRQESVSFQNDIRIGKDVLQLIAETRDENVDTTTLALNRKRTTNSFAASYVFKQDAHLASASIRNDRSSQYGSNTTGSVAYGYRFSDALRINASYGTSFRAPTFNELYYQGYGVATNKPEKAKNAEIGVYFEQGDTQLSAVYYQNKATDLLVSAGSKDCPAGYSFGCARNVNKATLSGLSIGGTTRFADLTVRGSIDIQDPKDDTANKRLARRAKQHGTLAAEYSFANAKLGVEAIYSGDRYDDAANTKVLGSYNLLNLYATYEVAKNTTVLARWNNALNKDYELARNYATAGSNVFVGVNYGFK